MLASEARPIDARPEPTWLNNSGFKLPLLVSGSEHMSFDDLECVRTIKLAAATDDVHAHLTRVDSGRVDAAVREHREESVLALAPVVLVQLGVVAPGVVATRI